MTPLSCNVMLGSSFQDRRQCIPFDVKQNFLNSDGQWMVIMVCLLLRFAWGLMVPTTTGQFWLVPLLSLQS
jgi:hypothetical protein